jgi:hypothetical protein
VLNEKSKQTTDGGVIVGDEDLECHARTPLCLGGLLAGSEPCGKEPATGEGTTGTIVL